MDTGSMEKREFTITICDDNSLQICVGGYCIRKPIVDWHEQAKGHPEAEKPTYKHEKGYVANGRQICGECGQDVTGAIPSSKCHPPVEKPGEKLAEEIAGYIAYHKPIMTSDEARLQVAKDIISIIRRSSSTEEVVIPRTDAEYIKWFDDGSPYFDALRICSRYHRRSIERR